MNDVRSPSEFSNSFDHSFTEEDGAFIVVFVEVIFLIVKHRLAVEIIFVINEVYL
jgi:hypothetical protein